MLARVLTGLVRLAHRRRSSNSSSIATADAEPGSWLAQNAFSIEATLVWGLVMWLFRRHRSTLQSSLQASMQYLYNDSDTWSSLWTLLIHNK